MKQIYFYLFSLILLIGVYSCSLDLPYENEFSDPDAIVSVTNAKELLAVAYKDLPNVEFELSILSDDFQESHHVDKVPLLKNLYKWQPESIRLLAETIWSDYYTSISTLNALLERAKNISVETAAEELELQSIINETKRLKAFCYYNLLLLFAPSFEEGKQQEGIILKDKLELQYLSRSSITDCLSTIKALLLESLSQENKDRKASFISQTTAYYLLADLSLYCDDYKEAEKYALMVLNVEGNDILDTKEYANLWGGTLSREALFATYNRTSFYTDLRYHVEHIPSDLGDFFTINDLIAEGYSANDIRKEHCVFSLDVPGSIIGDTIHSSFLGKYNKMNREKTEIKYINKYRVSGAYFILAEAYFFDPQKSDLDVRTVLNQYLTQRKASLIDDTLTGEVLLKSILTEKWKEFIGEGVRYFDLKRYRKSVLRDWIIPGKIEKTISGDNYRWTFPIPESEYLHNDLIIQNEGWTIIKNK